MPEGTRIETLTIPSDPARFRTVRAWLVALARQEGFAPDDERDLAIALSEVCANAHRHAYRGRRNGRIDIRVEIDAERLELTVRDYGKPFAVSGYQRPSLTAPREGGYGIFLMESLMDELRIVEKELGTHVVMIKHRHGVAVRR